jgi:5-(aminomethyl)-3-furanmethanol phosphate kinase
MWVVKLGGSLNGDPLLPRWLEMLAQLGGGRVTIVCGGGEFADAVRRSQALWHFDDLAAHNMAILAMEQSALLMRALCPALMLARGDAEIRRVLHLGRAAVRQADIPRLLQGGQTALWLPFELQRQWPDATTHWGHTSDSIALDLARQLNAERLVLVKSCAVDDTLPLAALGAAGVVDRRFARAASDAAFPIEIVSRDALAQLRGRLLAGSVPAPEWPPRRG